MPFCKLHSGDVLKISEHHLIPVTRHKNKKTKKDFNSNEVNKTVDVCQPCHSKIHSVFTEKELERNYNTLDKLKQHPEIEKFILWIRKHPQMINSSKIKRD